ncbi:MAG: hypothetical protein KKH98_05525 [Spirochaetes bacterium]|nr:hypothetical protein [Spirochaetota bacterium]
MKRSLLLILFAVLILNLSFPNLHAQSAKDLLQQADDKFDALQYKSAIILYGDVLKKDPANYRALWRTAHAYANRGVVLLGKDADDDVIEALYLKGASFAKKAIKVKPDGADGHALLSVCEGRLAMFAGGKRKVELSKNVQKEALLAIKYDPKHDGALHVLGVWHREVATLGGMLKFFAKVLYGGLPDASLKEAIAYMKKSVAIAPDNLEHHLDLGKCYEENDQEDLAMKEYKTVLSLPNKEAHDKDIKKEAKELIEDLE